jgi:hypothetical protein
MIAEVSWKELELVRRQLDEEIKNRTYELRLLSEELSERRTDDRKEMLDSIRQHVSTLRVLGWTEEPEAVLHSMADEVVKLNLAEDLFVKELEEQEESHLESLVNCKFLKRFIGRCNPVMNIERIESELAYLADEYLVGCPDGSVKLAIRFAHEMLLAAKEEPCEQN